MKVKGIYMYKPTISIYGKRNSGKSSILNAITEQEVSIVSSVKGTTTDPVKKTMEFNPVGPVVFIDTAGIDDEGDLGILRTKKSLSTARRTNIALYIMDIMDIDKDYLNMMGLLFKKYNIPYILVINKIDMVNEDYIDKLKSKYPKAIFVSAIKMINIDNLKKELIKRIQDVEADPPIVGDLVPYDGKIVLVVPIDKQAPKGRLILPQVQVIRDCIDNGIKCYVLRDTELKSGLKDLDDIDLVITDSQIFKEVDQIVPDDIKLTSFSILFARYKGDLKKLVDGVKAIEKLNAQDNILIAENCTHNTTHEDIGKVKIPTLLQQKTGKNLNFHFKSGYDFSEDLEKYSLIIHCGGCMVNRKEMESRIMLCNEKNIPITNYGVVLAYLNGILGRTLEIFEDN